MQLTGSPPHPTALSTASSTRYTVQVGAGNGYLFAPDELRLITGITVDLKPSSDLGNNAADELKLTHL